MNKIKLYALGLCLLAMSSCSDENKEFLNIGGGDKTSIECSNLDQIVEIPIESSGSWVASLSEDCNWVTILTSKGNNGVLRLVVDVNNSSKDYTATNRATTVTVKCGDQTCAIKLTQFAGASASDLGNNSIESELILTKGVGAGFDLMSNKTKYQIFNVNVIADFKDDDEIRQTFMVFPYAHQSAKVLEFNSLERKKDSIKVELSMIVSYGCFTLNVGGTYDSYEKKTNANFTYGQTAVLPREEARLGVLDLIAKYEANENEKATENEPNTNYKQSIEGIFTAGFRVCFENVKEAHAKNGKDSRDFKNGIAALVKDYGVVAITGATLGGQASMNVQVDTTEIKTDSLHIGGMASIAIQALISIDGKFNADYDKIGTEILKNSVINSFVQGGSNRESLDIYRALQKSAIEMKGSKGIREAVDKWQKTVVYNKNGRLNKTEVIEYRFIGIWNLFPYEMAEDVRLAVVELYKNNNKTMLDIKKLQLKKAIKK